MDGWFSLVYLIDLVGWFGLVRWLLCWFCVFGLVDLVSFVGVVGLVGWFGVVGWLVGWLVGLLVGRSVSPNRAVANCTFSSPAAVFFRKLVVVLDFML